jgi:tRNA 5-methylaminomethyl-2-thiouridine biosynthesis bifunctional protein
LIEAGFDMKKVKGFGTKREMLAGNLREKPKWTNTPPWFAYDSVEKLSDVAIIGGGIASATLAEALVRRGIQVTLYCRDKKPAQGASGNRQGAVYPLLNAQHDPLSRIFAPSFLYARQFFTQAADTCKFDHDWCGVTQLMWNEQSRKKLTPLTEGCFASQLVKGLGAGQTSECIGLPVSAASLHYEMGGWICPGQLTEQLIDHLVHQNQLTLQLSTDIESLRWDAQTSCWELYSGATKFKHQCVVIANGHRFDQLPFSAELPLAKVKGQVSHIPTTETLTKLKTVLCYDGYMTPVNPNNQQHCIGASYDRQHPDTSYDPAAQKQNRDKIKHCIADQSWPDDVDISGQNARQAIRCVSRDHLPFVGNLSTLASIQAQYPDLISQTEDKADKLQVVPNLYAFLGLGSRGLSSAPLLAELLASLMCSDPIPLATDLLTRLHPSRMWIRKLRQGKPIADSPVKPR